VKPARPGTRGAKQRALAGAVKQAQLAASDLETERRRRLTAEDAAREAMAQVATFTRPQRITGGTHDYTMRIRLRIDTTDQAYAIDNVIAVDLFRPWGMGDVSYMVERAAYDMARELIRTPGVLPGSKVTP